jgi:hypothetical protein
MKDGRACAKAEYDALSVIWKTVVFRTSVSSDAMRANVRIRGVAASGFRLP